MSPSLLQIYKQPTWHIGGVELTMKSIIDELPSWRHGVLFAQPMYTSHDQKDIFFKKNVTSYASVSLVELWSMPIAPKFLFHIYSISKRYDYILLHCPFPLNDFYFGIEGLFKKFSKPVIVFWHSDIIKQKNIQTLYKPLTYSLLKRSSSIWTTNPIIIKQSSILNTIYKEYPHKFHTISEWFTTDPIVLSTTQQLKNRHYKKQFGKFILNVGRLVSYKGQEFLIRAMPLIHSSHKLLIIGQGPLFQKLQKIIFQLNLQNRVFLQQATDQELACFYHTCDFFVLPSISQAEAFGRVQIEAMTWEKAIVNTQLYNGVNWVARNRYEALTTCAPSIKHLKGQEIFIQSLVKEINTLIDNPKLKHQLEVNAKTRTNTLFNKKNLSKKLNTLLLNNTSS